MKDSRKMEKAFLQDEVKFLRGEMQRLSEEHRRHWGAAMRSIRRFDGPRPCSFISKEDERLRSRKMSESALYLKRLNGERLILVGLLGQ